MMVGILSDTHDRFENISKALEQFEEHEVELVLHCGDIESPDAVRHFAGVPTHFVFGNCDWRPDALRYAIAEIGATLHEPFGELELNGKRLAWVHGHEKRRMRDLESADRYDFLFYGHTHMAEQHRSGKTLVVNPGALHRVREKTCVILDTKTGELESIKVL
jgi:putative phosphoesterase